MKVFELYSVGSIHSSVVEPAGSIHSSSDGHPGEHLQEERQPVAPCCMSSDENYTKWSVAIKCL